MNTSQEISTVWCSEDMPEYLGKIAIKGFMTEVQKGCTGEIYLNPLKSIQPQYDFFDGINSLGESSVKIKEPEYQNAMSTHVYVVILFHPEDGKLWYEGPFGILSQLSSINSPIVWECIATNKVTQFQFCVDYKFAEVIKSAIESNLPNSEVRISREDLLCHELKKRETKKPLIDAFYPNFPYHRNFVANGRKDMSHIFKLLQALRLNENELFYYRVIFEKVNKSWDRNCFNLATYEKKVINIYPELNLSNTYFISPVTSSNTYINKKSNPESMPFFFVQPLMCFWGEQKTYSVIKTFFTTFMYGDSAYNTASEKDFISALNLKQVFYFLANRTSHLQGHLLNREELSHLLSLPCEQTFNNEKFNILKTDGLKISQSFIDSDIQLGVVNTMDGSKNIGISIDDFEYSTFIMGKQGSGKSTLLLNILSQLGRL